MKFEIYGEKSNPVMLMLPGSFCPAKGLEYLYGRLQKEFCIVTVDYTGHYESEAYTVFSTRQEEASKIVTWLKKQEIKNIKLIYGQSMGAEVGIELMRQLLTTQITVEKAFFDGAPCIRFSKPVKALMFQVFRKMVEDIRNKPVEKLVRKKRYLSLTHNDADSLRRMLEEMKTTVPYISLETIRNEMECCYSFDFPVFMENIQQNMYFLYSREEKACRLCLNKIEKAYPAAEVQVLSGYGHLTFSMQKTDNYIEMIHKICSL